MHYRVNRVCCRGNNRVVYLLNHHDLYKSLQLIWIRAPVDLIHEYLIFKYIVWIAHSYKVTHRSKAQAWWYDIENSSGLFRNQHTEIHLPGMYGIIYSNLLISLGKGISRSLGSPHIKHAIKLLCNQLQILVVLYNRALVKIQNPDSRKNLRILLNSTITILTPTLSTVVTLIHASDMMPSGIVIYVYHYNWMGKCIQSIIDHSIA